MSQTCDQKRFTISEVAADWHELMILQCTMRPSIASVSEQLDPWSAAVLHTLDEPGKLFQWLCHDNSTTNTAVAITLLLAVCAGLQITSRSHGPASYLIDYYSHHLQYRSSQIAVGGHRHLHRPSNKRVTRWQKLSGRWSTAQPDIELREFRRLLKTFLFTWDIGT